MSLPNNSQLSFWDLGPPVESPPEPQSLPESPDPQDHVAEALPEAELARTFARVFRRLRIKRPEPTFEASYHPFAGLRTTVRMRHGKLLVRASDLLEKAPPLVIEALAEILLGQVYRLRPSREARDCYKAYILDSEVRRSVEEVRRLRGYKLLLPPRGRYFDLAAIFAKLNAQFFKGELIETRIGWSPNRSRSILGHYDSAHDTITISRWFDSRSVPEYVVSYLVYHEMLHAVFPVERNGYRRIVHSRRFLEAEKKFPLYERARQRLKRMSGNLEGIG